MAILLWTQARLVAPTNFLGDDEWTVLSLVSRGIVDIPYAQRPLALLWALPAPLLEPHSFGPFASLRWAYLGLTAWCVHWIALRLFPGRPALATLAAAFTVVWGPKDPLRLTLMEASLYWGITLGMLLAMAVFVESWLRRSRALLLLGALLAAASGLCYEATLPVLLASPALLVAREGWRDRALWRWSWGFLAGAVFVLALAAVPVLAGAAPSYQAVGLSLNPRDVSRRLLRQWMLQFGPLASFGGSGPLADAPALALALAAFLGMILVGRPGRRRPGDPPGDLRLLLASALLLTSAGYTAQLVTDRVPGAWRAQFLSAPGAALLLATAVVGLGERAGGGRLLPVALSAWVVAVGTGRTLALQSVWDAASAYPGQMRMLSALVRAVPETAPGSLLLLLDDAHVWHASFGFHHAVEQLYAGHAHGLVAGIPGLMLPAYFTPAGVSWEPIPAVRAAWRMPVRLYRYDEVVVLRYSSDGAIRVLSSWPPDLPPLPAGAAYAPENRRRTPTGVIPQRHALWSLGAAVVPGPS